MKPKITDTVAWQQAELLMQPAFIRIIDLVRQQLDQSTWKGTYRDVLIWPDGTTDEAKNVVTQLLQEMETAAPEALAEIQQNLAQLPIPHPGYQLHLEHQNLPPVSIDLWELCYQVCFLNYSSDTEEVKIDTSLIDETGDVNWQQLDNKVRTLVDRVFSKLPEA